MPAGGQLFVSLRRRGEMAEMQIRDTGRGIAPWIRLRLPHLHGEIADPQRVAGGNPSRGSDLASPTCSRSTAQVNDERTARYQLHVGMTAADRRGVEANVGEWVATDQGIGPIYRRAPGWLAIRIQNLHVLRLEESAGAAKRLQWAATHGIAFAGVRSGRESPIRARESRFT